jgi:hypothetical protein
MRSCGLVLLTSVAVLGAQRVFAQYQPPPPPLTAAPCKPTKKDPCTPPPSATALPVAAPSAAERFPFPGETPGTNPDTPGAATATPDHPPTADAAGRFPFPGDSDAPTSSSSSSSSSNAPAPSDSADPDGTAPDAAPERRTRTLAGRRKLAKVEDLNHREAEDLDVAHYYTTTGNFLAAYLRAKDAVATMPDDPEAHFALADGARRLKKDAEAALEYRKYIELEPQGDKVKASQKALAALGAH